MQRPCSGRPSLAGDGLHHSEYDPTLAAMLLGEAAHLLRAIGFAADHAILIGGMVPGLLVLDPGLGHPCPGPPKIGVDALAP